MYTYKRIHIRACIYAYMYTYKHTHTHIYIYIYIYVCIHAYLRAHIHTFVGGQPQTNQRAGDVGKAPVRRTRRGAWRGMMMMMVMTMMMMTMVVMMMMMIDLKKRHL